MAVVKSQLTSLSYKTTQAGSYIKINNLLDIPALGGSPNMIDTTSLDNEKFKTAEPGLLDLQSLEFTVQFNDTIYAAIDALKATECYWQLELNNPITSGSSGHGSQLTWQGKPSIWIDSAGTDEYVKMKLSISVSTELVFTSAV